jgi:CheY-like chemotaxis protein
LAVPWGCIEEAEMTKVLVIEDHESLREILQDILEVNGFETECAADGAEGTNKAKTLKPDIIILDIELPDASGMDLLADFKSFPETKDIPVLMSSANDMGNFVDKAYKLGASGYLLKPFKRDIIIKKIRELVPDQK